VLRKSGVVFLARETFLLGRRDDFAIGHEARGAVVVNADRPKINLELTTELRTWNTLAPSSFVGRRRRGAGRTMPPGLEQPEGRSALAGDRRLAGQARTAEASARS
jgi:hypothetical protein